MDVKQKGKRGERDALKAILAVRPDADVKREWERASIEGGHDLTMRLGRRTYAIEVKYSETLRLGPWWRQALRQADKAGFSPVLVYRRARRPWRVRFIADEPPVVATSDLVDWLKAL